jgi:hypothetical protein
MEDILGLNGSLVPFVKTKNLYFNDSNEPEEQLFEVADELAKESEKEGNLVIGLGDGDAASYYNAVYKSAKKFKENFKLYSEEDEDLLRVLFDDEEEESDGMIL